MEMVSFTEADLKEFKKVREQAVKDGKTDFVFKGNEYDCGYAKYLIEYLEGKFQHGK